MTIMGMLVVFGSEDIEQNRRISSSLFGAENSGEMIDKGTMYIGSAIALGILCEISKHLYRRNVSQPSAKAAEKSENN